MNISRAQVVKLLRTVDAGLTCGKGEPLPGKMCVEAAVCYALGLPHSDEPECVARDVRAVQIALNDRDWSSKKARARGLREAAVAQLGSADVVNRTNFESVFRKKVLQLVVPRVLRRLASRIAPSRREAVRRVAAALEKRPTNAVLDRAWIALDSVHLEISEPYRSALVTAKVVVAQLKNGGPGVSTTATVITELSDVAHRIAYEDSGTRAARSAYDAALATGAKALVAALRELKSPGCKFLGLCRA